MPRCKECGDEEKPTVDFFVRKSGYVPGLCKKHEREAARLRRRRDYAEDSRRVDIQNQNSLWRSRNSEALAERFRDRYREDPEFRERVLSRNKESRDSRHLSRTTPVTSVDGREFGTAAAFMAFVREQGYLPDPEPVEGIWRRLSQSRVMDPLPQSPCGLRYLDSVFPGRFLAKTKGSLSLHEAFHDDSVMMEVLRYLRGRGRRPDRESVLRNLKFRVRMPSHFFPDSASALVRELAPGGSVLDPMLGWGGRTLGALCGGASSVSGTDLQDASVSGCSRIAADLSERTSARTEFRACGFRDFMSSTDGRFDLVLTSPPFLDTENYGIRSFSSSEEWTKEILVPLCSLSRRVLSPGGVIAIHAQDRPGSPVLSLVLAAFSGSGYVLSREFRYGRRPNQKVLVFRP